MLVSIGLDNGLLLDGTKQLPELMIHCQLARGQLDPEEQT